MRLTKHAEARRRARGVNIHSLELIRCFGHVVRDKHGAKVCIANKRARKEILKRSKETLKQKQLKAVRRNFEGSDPLYFVEASDGTVITTGYRTRKIRRR